MQNEFNIAGGLRNSLSELWFIKQKWNECISSTESRIVNIIKGINRYKSNKNICILNISSSFRGHYQYELKNSNMLVWNRNGIGKCLFVYCKLIYDHADRFHYCWNQTWFRSDLKQKKNFPYKFSGKYMQIFSGIIFHTSWMETNIYFLVEWKRIFIFWLNIYFIVEWKWISIF